jgi:hypothetical protein
MWWEIPAGHGLRKKSMKIYGTKKCSSSLGTNFGTSPGLRFDGTFEKNRLKEIDGNWWPIDCHRYFSIATDNFRWLNKYKGYDPNFLCHRYSLHLMSFILTRQHNPFCDAVARKKRLFIIESIIAINRWHSIDGNRFSHRFCHRFWVVGKLCITYRNMQI